ncbi:MAG: hypothetical protein N2712_00600 [Brevinematales bacterium]|nr:hypothetical protein [Brevinematales bacterium]
MLRILILVVLILSTLSNINADETLSKVSNLINQLKHYEAINELEKAITKHPSSIPYYIFIIQISLDVNENELAEKYLSQALRYERDNITLNAFQIELERLKGNNKKAIEIAEKVLKNSSSRTNLTFVVSYSRLLASEHPYEAEKFLAPYMKIFNNHRIFTEMAKIQLSTGKLQHAKSNLDKALLLERVDKSIYSLYGEYYYRVGKLEESAKNLEKAILFPGNNSREYYLLSDIYFKLKEYKKSLEYAKIIPLPKETIASILYTSKNYSDLVKEFENPENEIIRYFIEESQIALSPQRISRERQNLSEERYKKAMKLKRKGIPYYNIYLSRSIRLNPLNFDSWFELGNYYKFYYSPYTALQEISIGKNLFVNNIKIQDFYENLVNFVSNSSKIANWEVDIQSPKNMKFLIEIEESNYPIEKIFYQNAITWALESIKLPNTELNISYQKNNTLSYKGYDIVISIKPEILKDYLILNISIIDPKSYRVITNVLTSQKFSEFFVSEIYQNLTRKILSSLPEYGIILGSKDNTLVVKYLKGVPNLNDNIIITYNNISSILNNNYNTIATGKIIDRDGEYGLVELDAEFKYKTTVKPGNLFIKTNF